jgi:hypothetical protein
MKTISTFVVYVVTVIALCATLTPDTAGKAILLTALLLVNFFWSSRRVNALDFT